MRNAATLNATWRRHWTSRRLPMGDLVVFAFSAVWFVGVLLPMAGVLMFSFVRAHAEGVSLDVTLDAYREIFATGRWEVTARTIRIAATVTSFC
jgi:ABC-type spermidine/putrescine transport system permease subunit I